MNGLMVTDCLKENERIHMLEISNILPNGKQPRKYFEDQALITLADSIQRHGIIQPLTVRRTIDRDKPYELISGERRLRAAQLLRMKRIPCIIASADEQTSAVLSIIENIQRQDLNIFEEAMSISRLKDSYCLTQENIAATLSVSQSYVANKLRILKLSENQQKLIIDNNMSERHCRALLRLPETERDKALGYMIRYKMNVSSAEAYVDRLLLKIKPTERKTKGKLKDLRIFYNTIDRAVNTARDLGVNVSRETLEEMDCTKVIISIRKKEECFM